MNKVNFLQWVVVGLLITNAIAITMVVWAHRKPAGPKAHIIELLHLDDTQIKAYEETVTQHRWAVEQNERTMEKLRSDLYQSLIQQPDTTTVVMLIGRIAEQQKKAEYINYNHFLAIKHICNPEQMDEFETLAKEIAELFSNKRRR